MCVCMCAGAVRVARVIPAPRHHCSIAHSAAQATQASCKTADRCPCHLILDPVASVRNTYNGWPSSDSLLQQGCCCAQADEDGCYAFVWIPALPQAVRQATSTLVKGTSSSSLTSSQGTTTAVPGSSNTSQAQAALADLELSAALYCAPVLDSAEWSTILKDAQVCGCS